MPLAKQLVPVSFAGGVDTKTDSKQVVAGKLLLLENAVFTSPKRLKKRNGYESLSMAVLDASVTDPADVTNVRGITSYGDSLVLFADNKLFDYNVSTSQWAYKGASSRDTHRQALHSVIVTHHPVVRNPATQSAQDSATHSNGVQVFAWEDTEGGVRYAVVDRTTSQVLKASTLVAADLDSPKVLVLGNQIVIVARNTSTHNLYFYNVPVATPTVALSAGVLLTSGMHTTNRHYDACVLGSNLYVAFNNNAGSTSFAILRSNLTVATTGVVMASGAATNCITVFPNTESALLMVAYHTGTEVRYYSVNATLDVAAADTLVSTIGTLRSITGVCVGEDQNFYLFYTFAAASSSDDEVLDCHIVDGVVGAEIETRLSISLAGKAFTRDDRVYVPVSHTSALQSTYFIISHLVSAPNGEDPAPGAADIVAKILPSLGGGLTSRSLLAETNYLGDGEYQIALLMKDLLTTETTTTNPAEFTPVANVYTSTGVTSVTIAFEDDQNAFLRAELGSNLHISGGYLSMYDGVAPVEHGFHLYPEGLETTVVASGGSIGTGTFQFVACYEWTDAQGQVHRSAPSVPVSVEVVSGAVNSIEVEIPTLRLTHKRDATIIVYRTEANGLTFYRDSSATAPDWNDTLANSITFTSTQADTTLVGRPLLYTTGGVVENIGAPACAAMTTFTNRIVLLPTEAGLSWWYSKEVIPGQPVEFSDFFVESVDPQGGNLVAPATLDDKLILFKRNSIFAVAGTGPDATGNNNDFSGARLVSTDCGCINPRSVVITPMGLMFRGTKGIYLLSRSLEVTYIGADVEAYNDQTIVSAVLVPATNQVRFGLADSTTALVYDYRADQWCVFTNHPQVDATVWQEKYTFLRPTAETWQENGSTDSGQAIKMKLSTSWLTVSALSGFQRVYHMLLLGEYAATHNLRVGVSYDYNPAVVQTEIIEPVAPDTYGSGSTWGSDDVWGGDYPLYQYRVNFTRQKCTAVQLTLEDLQTSETAGDSASWSALTFQVGQKVGSNKLPAARRYGTN